MKNSLIDARIEKTLSEKKRSNLFRTLAPAAGPYDIDLSTNSYLWLHADPGVAREASTLVGRQLYGNLASRLVSSSSALFSELEAEIAAWKGAEAALVFNSGYAANTGMIQAICTPETEVFSDNLNHASIIDGIRLSKAKVARFKHCDVSDLKALLDASPARERIIITDSVFSMDGDRAPLADICDLARRFQCMVMVDEAHAAGVFGKNASGLIEELGLEKDVDIRMGTLSKAIAGMGAFFAGSTMLRDFFINTGRSLIYSTALPHAVLAWDLAAIRHIRKHPEGGKRLLGKAAGFRDSLKEMGFDTGTSSTHIVPCIVGDEASALSLSAHLKERKIKAPAIRPPTVPAGKACVRFSTHLGLTEEDGCRVVEAMGKWKAGKKIP
jgi:8-amino-7-oxononanoate synthase